MKKLFVLGFIISVAFSMSCEDWYKNMREKYNIIGVRTGIVIDKNGNWQKIFAKGVASVDFDDTDEYEDAIMEAEMKAKAELTHFLKERLSSDKTLDTISKTLKELKSNGKIQSKNIDKKTLKIKTQKIHNYANSLLKGILILCESIDNKNKRAIVVVGVSPKTQRAADSARKSMYENTTNKTVNSNNEKVNVKGYIDASTNLDF